MAATTAKRLARCAAWLPLAAALLVALSAVPACADPTVSLAGLGGVQPLSKGQMRLVSFRLNPAPVADVTVNFQVTGDAPYGTEYAVRGAATFNPVTMSGTMLFKANGFDYNGLTLEPRGSATTGHTVKVTVTAGAGYSIDGTEYFREFAIDSPNVPSYTRFDKGILDAITPGGSASVRVSRSQAAPTGGDWLNFTVSSQTLKFGTTAGGGVDVVVSTGQSSDDITPYVSFNNYVVEVKLWFAQGSTSRNLQLAVRGDLSVAHSDKHRVWLGVYDANGPPQTRYCQQVCSSVMDVVAGTYIQPLVTSDIETIDYPEGKLALIGAVAKAGIPAGGMTVTYTLAGDAVLGTDFEVLGGDSFDAASKTGTLKFVDNGFAFNLAFLYFKTGGTPGRRVIITFLPDPKFMLAGDPIIYTSVDSTPAKLPAFEGLDSGVVPLGSSVTVNVKLPAPLGTDQQIPVVVFSQSATVGDAAAGRDITLAGADATDQVSSPKEAEMNKIAMVTLKFPAGTTSKAVTLTASSSAKVSQRVWLGLFSIDDKQQGADVTCGEPGVTRVDIGEPIGIASYDWSMRFSKARVCVEGLDCTLDAVITAAKKKFGLDAANSKDVFESAGALAAVAGLTVNIDIDWKDGSPHWTGQMSIDGTTASYYKVVPHTYPVGTFSPTFTVSDGNTTLAVPASSTSGVVVQTPTKASLKGAGTLDSPAGALRSRPDLKGPASLKVRGKYSIKKSKKLNVTLVNLKGSMFFQIKPKGGKPFKATSKLGKGSLAVVQDSKFIAIGNATVVDNGKSTTGCRFEAYFLGGALKSTTVSARLVIYDPSGAVLYDSSATGNTCTGFDDMAAAVSSLKKGAFLIKMPKA